MVAYFSKSWTQYEMISSVRFCLSKDNLNVILLPTKFVYFNENVHC